MGILFTQSHFFRFSFPFPDQAEGTEGTDGQEDQEGQEAPEVPAQEEREEEEEPEEEVPETPPKSELEVSIGYAHNTFSEI